MMSATRLLAPVRGSVVAAKRYFAAAAAVPMDVPLPNITSDPKPFFTTDYKTTTLPNGVVVVSNDSSSPVGAVSVVVRAGSRQEDAASAGVSHYLRSVAFQSTKTSTAVRNVREADNKAIDLAATGDREFVTYNATFLRDYVGDAASLLVDTITAPQLYPWEVRAQDARVKLDRAIAKSQPQIALLNDVNDAAFRNTLGRGIFAPSWAVGKVSETDIAAYTAKFFTGDRIVVVGSGVDHEQLVSAVSGLKNLPASKQADKAAKYFGKAEVRHVKDLPRVQAALAFQGAAKGDKEASAFDVLAIVIGSAPSVQWSSASSSKVPGASGFSIKYSDSGLVGAYFTSCPKNAEKNITSAAAALQKTLSGGITAEDVARAKLQLIAKSTESERLCKQKCVAGQVFAKKGASASAYVNSVEAVSLADVQAAAKRALASKPVYAVRGKLDNVPYLDSLSF